MILEVGRSAGHAALVIDFEVPVGPVSFCVDDTVVSAACGRSLLSEQFSRPTTNGLTG
jgi:hypothetical protein